MSKFELSGGFKVDADDVDSNFSVATLTHDDPSRDFGTELTIPQNVADTIEIMREYRIQAFRESLHSIDGLSNLTPLDSNFCTEFVDISQLIRRLNYLKNQAKDCIEKKDLARFEAEILKLKTTELIFNPFYSIEGIVGTDLKNIFKDIKYTFYGKLEGDSVVYYDDTNTGHRREDTDPLKRWHKDGNTPDNIFMIAIKNGKKYSKGFPGPGSVSEPQLIAK